MRYPIEHFVRAIIEGRHDEVEQPAPLWEPDALGSFTRRKLAGANRPSWSDPRHNALKVGARLLPRAPRGLCGEGCAANVVAYDYGTCPKHRGLLVGHGTQHHLFKRQPDDFTEADVWIATGLWLIPPHHSHSMGLAEIIARAHAPEWFVRLVVSSRRGCFFGASDESYRL